ncbi:transcriptional regulator [Chengkuizengella sediminis]|uniref:transcriptional regulator n=1 Tax=Chengkuizengella sediminis TaxID=1885917 RepID=UPI00138A4E51|nr:transcriptional regulator [Chengkuizengella sediminis]NDI34545.1 transcriptional regulator [Chengkuizengella sediminis]
MFGLGKPRTKFGKFIDKKEISQTWVSENCGIDKNTTSRLTGNDDYKPNRSTKHRVVSGLRKKGEEVDESDFW